MSTLDAKLILRAEKSVELDNSMILAPMAGYTDYAYRRLCARAGVGLTVTEMVSAKGLVYSPDKCAELLVTAPEERVKCVQLFGHEPEVFAKALCSTLLDKFDIIDINMGCPVPKIVKNGEGSALIKDPDLAAKIVEACVKNAHGRPVTVKTRMGFFTGENSIEKFALRMQDAGASAVTVHGRTREQGYMGVADWSAVTATAAACDIPVIGSGDVGEDNAADRVKDCAAVMIGRRALGDPWIFARLLGKSDLMNKRDTIAAHVELMTEAYGERYAVVNMRKHIGYYLRGMRDTRDVKTDFYTATTVSRLMEIINRIER